MIEYTKHKVWRVEELNCDYFEVLLSKESLSFAPGTCVKLYKSPLPPVFIASGLQEAWIRLIMNRDIYRDLFEEKPLNIKLERDINNPLPTLFTEEEPSFVVTPEGVGAFFSYVSTFPRKKLKVCYLGKNKVQLNWIAQKHKLVQPGDLTKDDNIYLAGNEKVIKAEAADIISISKGKYYCE